MDGWLPESNWDKDSEKDKLDWRGDEHPEENPCGEPWASESSELENPYDQDILKLEKSLGELEHKKALSYGIHSIFHFRFAELYLQMAADKNLETTHMGAFWLAYLNYDEGVKLYRKARADFSDTTRTAAKKHFLRVTKLLGSKNAYSQLFKDCTSEDLIRESVDIEGLENG